jgi:hypothetical protein
MINELLQRLLALAQGEQWIAVSSRSHAIAHRNNGDIPISLYGDLLDKLVGCIADTAGNDRPVEYQAAWHQQTHA